MDRKNLFIKNGELLTPIRVVYGVFLEAKYDSKTDGVSFTMAIKKGKDPEVIENIQLPNNKSWKTLMFKLVRGTPIIAVISPENDALSIKAFSVGTGLIFNMVEPNKKLKRNVDKSLIVGNVQKIEEINDQLCIHLIVGRGLDKHAVNLKNIFVKTDVSDGFKNLIMSFPENQTIGFIATKKMEKDKPVYILDDLQVFPKVETTTEAEGTVEVETEN